MADIPVERTEELTADLQRLEAAPCASCGGPMCGHQRLYSFLLGFRDEPRCAACLAAKLGRDASEFRTHVAGFLLARPCYREAWEWTGRREPGCAEAAAGR